VGYRLLTSSLRLSETSVLIVNSIKSQLQCTLLDHVTGPFIGGRLDKRSENVATRLILVTYQQTWSVNRIIIEVLGSRFLIDPVFPGRLLIMGYVKSSWKITKSSCR